MPADRLTKALPKQKQAHFRELGVYRVPGMVHGRITKSIQTGKSIDRHDNGTIQNYIHCLIIDVRTDWKNNGLCHFS
ncbi:hypothetical protein ACN42_g9872 [Penicillium freii]|uniref:Uncharacterized protein n=1 Tax=Penicillium freii TaxID=48697 RepID=A0A124GQ85_PENFR|nr:hypothetical protein ACN42_g9872 [Penicillium freii]